MSSPIPGYLYPPPSREDFLSSLTRVLGPEEGARAWDHACHVADVSAKGVEPAAEQLHAVAQALIRMDGLRSVVGNSMVVRLLTYESLARRTQATGGEEQP
jgi:hypothetical protein